MKQSRFGWFYGLRAFELDPTLAEPRTHVAYHPQKCHYEDAYSYQLAGSREGHGACARLESEFAP